jgi:hypothetical protein
METPRFRFRCSYRNQISYAVYGATETDEIEQYTPLGWLEESEHKGYNGTEAEYQADVVAKIGGVANRTGDYRMSQPVWAAFRAWLTAEHAEQAARIMAQPEKYGDWKPEPLSIPRPIYWDVTLRTWATEPWYAEGRQ